MAAANSRRRQAGRHVEGRRGGDGVEGGVQGEALGVGGCWCHPAGGEGCDGQGGALVCAPQHRKVQNEHVPCDISSDSTISVGRVCCSGWVLSTPGGACSSRAVCVLVGEGCGRVWLSASTGSVWMQHEHVHAHVHGPVQGHVVLRAVTVCSRRGVDVAAAHSQQEWRAWLQSTARVLACLTHLGSSCVHSLAALV
jgi:hypothetical protein